jgi:hypothetical protein
VFGSVFKALLHGKTMSAISSGLSSFLLPTYSSASKHGASCNCSSCASSGTSSSSKSSGSSSTGGANDSSNSGQSNNSSTVLSAAGTPLTQSQQNEVAELKKIDAAVRRHEQAHLSAAGGYARSGIVLNFKAGPDGKEYAIGGHVDIDTSPVKGNPAATIAKMETVQRAALAPVDPSAQDVRVAAEAGQAASKARVQEAQQQQQAAQTGGATTSATSGAGPITGVSSAASPKSGNLKLSMSAKYSKSPSSASNSSAASSFSGQLLDVVG